MSSRVRSVRSKTKQMEKTTLTPTTICDGFFIRNIPVAALQSQMLTSEKERTVKQKCQAILTLRQRNESSRGPARQGKQKLMIFFTAHPALLSELPLSCFYPSTALGFGQDLIFFLPFHTAPVSRLQFKVLPRTRTISDGPSRASLGTLHSTLAQRCASLCAYLLFIFILHATADARDGTR